MKIWKCYPANGYESLVFEEPMKSEERRTYDGRSHLQTWIPKKVVKAKANSKKPLGDCPGFEKSVTVKFNDGRIMCFAKYCFREEVVHDVPIFKIIDEPLSRIFVSDIFKSIVEENKLKGFKFELVWDSEEKKNQNEISDEKRLDAITNYSIEQKDIVYNVDVPDSLLKKAIQCLGKVNKFAMGELLKCLILSQIENWCADYIYVISLYVSDQNDNPCRPTVTFGYNTEGQVKTTTKDAFDEQEARWNYAFWLQNSYFCFGNGNTEKYIIEWLESNDLPNYDDDDEAWDDDDTYDEVEIVTEKFVEELVQIVKEIHESGILTKKFGKEIPIIIHELEYYEEIAKQNVEANGLAGIEDFVDFCG